MLLVIGRPALAALTTGYSFGLDGSGFQFVPHSDSGLDTAISSSFTTTTTAHAQSWAYAKLSGNVLTKITGGAGWVDGTNPSEYFLWSAFASGTELIVTGPAPGTMVELQLVLPSSSTANNQRPSTLPGAPPEVGNTPVQGFTRNDVGLNLPSFFDVFVELDASVQQAQSGATFTQSLFNGSATLKSDGTVNPIGNFDGVFGEAQITGSRSTVLIENDVVRPFMIEAGVPFQLTMELFMTMGDPDRQGTSESTVPIFSGIDTAGVPLGGGGSFITELHVVTPNATLSVVPDSVIPEPASIAVWMLGLVASLGFFRRRR